MRSSAWHTNEKSYVILASVKASDARSTRACTIGGATAPMRYSAVLSVLVVQAIITTIQMARMIAQRLTLAGTLL